MNGDTNRSGHAGPGRRVAGAAPDQKVAPAANSTMEVARPAEAEPTLAEMMAKATTHHEWGLVVAALSREIAQARRELAELERGNEAAALAGLEANKAHLWEVFASTERVKQLVLTLGTAKEREGAAQTVEIDAKMIADARKAVEETLPRVKAKLRRIYDALMALPGLVDELVAELAVFEGLQAHASRRLEQAPTPELRELVIRICASAARQPPHSLGRSSRHRRRARWVSVTASISRPSLPWT